MQNRLTGMVAALAAVALASGCGLTGSPPREPSVRAGQISIGDRTQHTKSVSCTQNAWDLTIKVNSDAGRAQVALQLGGETPDVTTVNIENIDGMSGVAGRDVSPATASVNGSIYKITGTAVASDRAHPGQTQKVPFEIDAPC